MIAYMIDSRGRRRIAEFVKAAMGWSGVSGPAIERTGRVSRATVDRIKRGDDRVSDTMLRALGDVLELPRDFLMYVGTGDAKQIAASGGDPDLVRWTLELIEESREWGNPDPYRNNPGHGRRSSVGR